MPKITLFFIITLVSCTHSPRKRLISSKDYSDLSTFLNQDHIQRKLDDLTKSIRTFNKVEFLNLGQESFDKRRELIIKSRNYIYQIIPYWYPDFYGTKMMEVFEDQRKRNFNLDIRFIMDWSTLASSGDLSGKKVYRRMEKVSKGQIFEWNSPKWFRPWSFQLLDNHVHEKIFVVDGKYLILGGRNHGDDYFGPDKKGWSDKDIYIEGPGAQEATKIFLKTYLLGVHLKKRFSRFPLFLKKRVYYLQSLFYPKGPEEKLKEKNYKIKDKWKVHLKMNKLLRNKSIFPDLPDKPEYDTPVRIIYDNPLVDKRYNEKGKIRKFSKFKNTMEFLLKNAKDSAMFYIPYFSLTDKFKALLIREAKRGLKITILSNSFQSLDIGGKILYGVATYHFNDLLEAGVQIYEWTGHKPLEEIEKKENCSIPWGHWPGGTIHGKMALIDDQVSLIGSHNMNTRSERFNSETMAMVVDKKFGEKVKKAFLYDLDDVPNGEKRTIPCGDIMVERPRRVHHLTREEFNKKYSPRDIRKLKKYLKLRNIL